METSNLTTKLKNLLRQRNLFAFVGLILILANFLLIILLLSSKKSVILVPSTVQEKMTVSEDKMSASYVQSFARDIILTYSNITPQNIDYSNSVILKFVPSSDYSSLKSELEQRANGIKKTGASQHFYLNEMEMIDNKSVIVGGELSIFIGGKLIEKKKKEYLLSFEMKNMIIKLIEFQETNSKNV